MRISVTAAQVGDVVLDNDTKVWRKDSAEPEFWSTFGMPGGAMGGAPVPAPVGEVALLVRDGAQMCCTPDPEPVAKPAADVPTHGMMDAGVDGGMG